MQSGMFICFGVGLACLSLIAGAEALVRGASRLATIIGISPLVIGLTVVTYGTSAPEAAVSVYSAFRGKPIWHSAMSWAVTSSTCYSSSASPR